MAAETAAKALILYERRAYGIYRRVKAAPDGEKILSAYGRLLPLREDMIHDFAWITAAVDSIHSELVNGLIDFAADETVIALLRSDPVLRYEAELLTAEEEGA